MNSKELSKEIAKRIGLLSMQLVTMEAQNRAIMQGQAIILNLLMNKEKADKAGEEKAMQILYRIYERELVKITSDLSESGQHGPSEIFRKPDNN